MRRPALAMTLVTIVLTVLGLAPGASASMSIVDAVENPFGFGKTEGGQFSTSINGLAVNESGNGGVGAGDFYVADGGNNRIQRFSSTGVFREAWGYDGVLTGPGNANAIQSLTVDASGGQFKLSFGADTTTDLAYNASAALVQGALQALPSIGTGNVTVTGGPGGGDVPYGIFFEGSLAGTAQSAIVAANGTTPLSGGAGTTVRTLNGGGGAGTGFELCKAGQECKAAAISALGGGMNNPSGIAVQQSTGNVFVTSPNSNRVDVFTATGIFVRSFGIDVVAAGKVGDAPARPAKQTLTVKATGGSFKLGFQGQTTPDLSFDAGAAEVEAALRGLSSVGPTGVSVSGGPGDEAGTTPYLLTFGGQLDSSPQPPVSVISSLSGSGAGVDVVTTESGRTGAEVCTEPADCKGGVSNGVAGSVGNATGIAFAPAGAPNAGNLLVAEGVSSRISEYTPAGAFVRSFGFDVVNFGPGNSGGFEVCRAASFDSCKVGETGTAVGQFSTVGRVAEDAAGNIFAINVGNANLRIQKFTLAGDAITPQGNFAPDGLKGEVPTYRPGDVAIGPDNHIFVTQVYRKGDQPVCIETETTPETLIHEFDADGNLLDTHLECGFTSGGGGILASSADSRALAVNTVTGRTFLTLAKHAVLLVDEPGGPNVEVEATTDVRATSATLHATIEPLPGRWSTYYHFEVQEVGDLEWQRFPPVRFSDPSLGNGTGSGPPTACPSGNPPVCEVETMATGLRPETDYTVRLMAYTWTGTNASGSGLGTMFGGYQQVLGETFTTVPSPPTAITGDARWSSPASTQPSLNLGGELNAANRRTTFLFEYVTEEQFEASGWSNAAVAPKAPARPAEAGKNFINVAVRQTVAGLDPTVDYRYRLVATNPNGTDHGDAEFVAAPKDDDRFLERVSNGDGEGMGAAAGFGRAIYKISPDGAAVIFASQSMDSPRSLAGLQTPFRAERTAQGWKVVQVGADPATAYGDYLPGDFNVADDLSGVLWRTHTREDYFRRSPTFSFSSSDGSIDELLRIEPTNLQPAQIAVWNVVGGASDFSTIAFSVPNRVNLLPGERPVQSGAGAGNYFQITGARSGNPTLALVNQNTAGEQIGGPCVPVYGSSGQNASGEVTMRSSISEDGSVIFFSANPTPPAATSCTVSVRNANPQRLYKRVDAQETVEVSAPQCGGPCGGPNGVDIFRGASLDGSRVVFKTVKRLVPADLDSTADIYLHDESPPAGQPKLVQVSAGEVTPSHPVPGTGAAALGVASLAADGTRVYFTATGALAEGATPSTSNLYVFRRDAEHPTGTIEFVANLSSGESTRLTFNQAQTWNFPVRAEGDEAGDGRFLFFVTADQLSAGDADIVDDLYRFDAEAGSDPLQCLSCSGDGAFGVEIKSQRNFTESLKTEQQVASDDGRVAVFWTKESLIEDDANDGLDVYAWNDGELELITPEAIPDSKPRPEGGTNADGSAVYFVTSSQLVPEDPNTAIDVYVSRVGGGFPAAEETFLTCLSAAECKGDGVAVSAPVTPGTSGYAGPGTPSLKSAPKKCKKGQVRKKGKCVKKKAKKPKAKKGKNAKKVKTAKKGAGR